MLMRHKFNWVIALLFIVFLPSCTDKNTPEQPDEQQAKYYVIYDTDIGSSTDDLFALKILYNASKRGQCELIGGVVCRMGESKAALADLMNTHYFADAHLPLGIERNGVEEPNEYISYEGIADLQKEDQTTMFPRSTSDYSTLPDGWKLYRKLLADKPDRSVKICAIGFMCTLVHLLESEPDEYSPLSGVELVKQKVHSIYVMGGKFGEESLRPGYNFGHKGALEYSKRFFDLLPGEVKVYFSPSIVGDGVDYPTDLVLSDIDWTDEDPIKQVYMNYDCNTGQRMWDALSALNLLYADLLFDFSPAGEVYINDNDEMVYTPDPEGNDYYQIYDEEMNAVYLKLIRRETVWR